LSDKKKQKEKKDEPIYVKKKYKRLKSNRIATAIPTARDSTVRQNVKSTAEDVKKSYNKRLTNKKSKD